MALDASLRTRISDLVTQNRVVLFMKGTRQSPQCGFSAQVVQILDGLLPSYETVDVLRSPEIRAGIKDFSEWPTIPQLYVDGRFVGGCDIVGEMNRSGALARLLGASVPEPTVPSVTMSQAAVKAFEAALGEAAGDSLRLGIDADWQNELFIAPREPGDTEVLVSGLTLLLDGPSVRRADGVHIDFVEGPGGGFRIDNPNAPPIVKPLTAAELKSRLDRGDIALFDVRPDDERALAHIAAARPLDAAGHAILSGLDRSTPIALLCHHGVRSLDAAERLIRQGYRNVYNVKGGIDAWSQTVDPAVPRY
jgi:monothiol glutaredoxin